METQTQNNQVVQVWNEFEGTFNAFWNEEEKWWESVDPIVWGNFEKNSVVRVGYMFNDMKDLNEQLSAAQNQEKPRGEFGYFSNFRLVAASENDTIIEHLMKRPTKKEINKLVAQAKEKFGNTAITVTVDCVWYQTFDGETMPTDIEASVIVYKQK
jgi:hypothetical protein